MVGLDVTGSGAVSAGFGDVPLGLCRDANDTSTECERGSSVLMTGSL